MVIVLIRKELYVLFSELGILCWKKYFMLFIVSLFIVFIIRSWGMIRNVEIKLLDFNFCFIVNVIVKYGIESNILRFIFNVL